MTEKIGKYRIKIDNDILRVTYRYTFSDLIGGVGYLAGFAFGIMALYVAFRDFTWESIYNLNFWFVSIVGIILFGFCLYIIALALYNPSSGIIEINKPKNEVIIRDFPKNTIIEVSAIASIYCVLTKTSRPLQKYGMFTIRTKNGKEIECFIVRSSMPIDLGKKIEKDIYDTTMGLRTRIFDFINGRM